MKLEKNMTIDVIIEGLGINGEGIARSHDSTIFIPYALPGERVQIKILSVKKTHAFGKVLDNPAPADERIMHECPVYSQCGGCQLQHLKYKDQLAFKTVVVKDTLKKIGKINYNVPVCHKSEKIYGYRNKMQMPISLCQKDNTLIMGFYANNSHRIVRTNNCPLHGSWNESIIKIVKNFLIKNNIPGYVDEKQSGIVRHLVVRNVDKKMQITIVINADTLKNSDELVQELKKEFNNCSIFLNVNKQHNNVVLGDKFIKLHGEDDLTTKDMGLNIKISPDSFLQVNSNVKTRLYNKAVDLASVTEKDVVIDAYSGIGILSSLLAKNAKHVYAIEIVEKAIENANWIKENNNLQDKITNTYGDCDKILNDTIEKARELSDDKTILILDPPRKGVSLTIIDNLISNPVDKIIYISCNPATLARDLGMLLGTIDIEKYKTTIPKYNIEYLRPFDMFPQTKHVETVVSLTKI